MLISTPPHCDAQAAMPPASPYIRTIRRIRAQLRSFLLSLSSFFFAPSSQSMFPVHSAPRSLSRQTSPPSLLSSALRGRSSAAGAIFDIDARETFVGSSGVLRLMTISLVHHVAPVTRYAPAHARRAAELMMEGRLESALTGIKFLERKTSVAALGVRPAYVAN
jgi:hypothetical protein